MSHPKATHQQTKAHNRDLVLQTIFEHETISRAEIARLTRLTRATVSDMVNILLAEGLVEEVGYGESIGGKAPILLRLVADARYLIGLNLAQDCFIGAVVNLRGEIKERVEFPVNDSNGEQALQLVYTILDTLTQKGWRPLVGIGIGTPGLVNTREGIVVNAVNLDWKNLPLAKLLEARYHLPVMVLNDSQATAIGEFVHGADYPMDGNLVVVTIGHGLGAGILIRGRLYQGDGGGAGEIGHTRAQENGALCRCGQRGCLETIASTRAILQRVRASAPEFPTSHLARDVENLSLEHIAAAWQAHDPLAEKVLLEAAYHLGVSLGSLVGILNIQNIVLAGEVQRFGARWLDAIRETMLQVALPKLAQETRLAFGKLDFKACILGASAFMLLDNYALLFMQQTN